MKMQWKLVGVIACGAVATLAAGGIAIAQMEPGLGPFGRADTNKDGAISRAEWMQDAATRFTELDANKDDKLIAAELPRPPHGGHGPHGPGRPDFRGGDDDRGMGPPPPPPPADNAAAPQTPGK